VNELKPCPFCGGKAKMHDEQVAEDCVEAWVICIDCGASSGRVEGAYSDRPTAAAAWNRRHEMPKSMVHRLATQMGWSPPSTPKQGEGE
jgi:Lar family restriction alleviation protein